MPTIFLKCKWRSNKHVRSQNEYFEMDYYATDLETRIV